MDGGLAGQSILVGIDGSANARKAFAWAVAEARFRNTEVEAAHVFHVPALALGAPGYLPTSAEEVDAVATTTLAEAVAETPGSGDVKVRLRATSGPALEVLRHAAEDPSIGLVVVGAQGHGVVGRLLLGSVSLGLAHQCPKPLVIVPRDWPSDSSASAGPLEVITPKIVVGVDGSEQSHRALEWAVHEGAVREAAVKAVMVWSTPQPVQPARIPRGAAASAAGDDVTENPLLDIVDQLDRGGVRVEAEMVQGRPAETLMDLAARGQLLVVGRRGLGWVREKLLGSVSRACAQHAPVPVVIVPSEPAGAQ